jgi:precorrin-6Y C5,15-methyltransferase (decarboxylating)
MGLGPDDLTAGHLDIIKQADVLIAGQRLLDFFDDLPVQKKKIDKNLKEVVDFILRHMETQSIVVLASGDPLFFGIGSRIVNAVGSNNVRIYPNVSSVAAAFARIKEPWNNATVVSLHGRQNENKLFNCLQKKELVVVFTDPRRNPAWLAQRLIEKGLVNIKLCVLESLGTPSERVNWYRPHQAAKIDFSDPNLVIIKREPMAFDDNFQPFVGMPDDWFDHGEGLITKSEIRALTLSKLRLRPEHIVWDLGAGSGSVAVEAALLVKKGRVFAVEKKSGRINQIQSNKARFGTTNLAIIQAELPDGLAQLPPPDRIFIGGGGQNLANIIHAAAAVLNPDGIMVVNTVLLTNVNQTLETFKELGLRTHIVQVQINRGSEMPWGERLDAQNPVWIITALR